MGLDGVNDLERRSTWSLWNFGRRYCVTARETIQSSSIRISKHLKTPLHKKHFKVKIKRTCRCRDSNSSRILSSYRPDRCLCRTCIQIQELLEVRYGVLDSEYLRNSCSESHAIRGVGPEEAQQICCYRSVPFPLGVRFGRSGQPV